jgi:hypothetical protein
VSLTVKRLALKQKSKRTGTQNFNLAYKAISCGFVFTVEMRACVEKPLKANFLLRRKLDDLYRRNIVSVQRRKAPNQLFGDKLTRFVSRRAR